jgi:hypothetical protein
MQQTQEEPLHWDNHRTKLNLTFIFALVVVVFGILGQPALFVIGIGVAIYSWLTNPKQYLIYPDSLVIIYGRPRVKSYPFQDIANLELLTLPMGDRLRVRMVNGSRFMLMTKDSDTFRAKLDEALEAFHSGQAGSDYGYNGNSADSRQDSPMVIEGEVLSEVPVDSEIIEPDIVEPEITEETPPNNRMGESSTENDDVPY